MSTARNNEVTLRNRSSTSSTEEYDRSSYTPPPRHYQITGGQSGDGGHAVNRLADVMTSFLEEIGKTRQPSMVRGDAVPPFDPENADQTIEDWCTKVDELRQMFRWSEDLTIFHALAKLQGLASVWYRGLKSVKFSWAEWKTQLCRAFPSQRDYHERLQEMLRRRKRTDESFARYFYEKQALLNGCKISGRDAVSCIIGGISENHIKSAARAGNFGDPEALFEYLRCLTDDAKSQTRQFPQKSSASFSRKRKYDGVGKSGHCFGCKKPGHMRKDCPMTNERKLPEITCYVCKEKGHVATNCSKRPKPSHVA